MRTRSMRSVATRKSSAKAQNQQSIAMSPMRPSARDPTSAQSSVNMLRRRTRSMGHAIDEQCSIPSETTSHDEIALQQPPNPSDPKISDQLELGKRKRTGRDVPIKQCSNQATQQEKTGNACSNQTDTLDESVPIMPRPGRRFNLHGKVLKEGVRGPTYMSKVWGQQGNKRIAVSFNEFGQPNDKESSSIFAHFLGTLAQDGTYASLEFQTWRDIPEECKKKMLNVVKSKFDLPPGKNRFILQSISKKWRAWKSFLKAEYFDLEIPLDELEKPPDDDRVDEQQWKKLIGYWLEEKAMEVSMRNKKNRAQQKMVHCTGKRSLAVVRELEEERLGRALSRADMFITCYTKSNGAPANEVAGDDIAQMKELINEAPNENERVTEDNVYSKVMGAEKSGRVQTYGLGVSSTKVWGAQPSHASCHKLAMEYKTKFECMEKQMEELKSLVMQHRPKDGGSERNPSSPSNGTCRPSSEHTPSFEDISDAQSSEHRPPTPVVAPTPTVPNFQIKPIQVGSFVILKSIINLGEKVAKAIVHSMDPSSRVGGKMLGPNWCEVHVLSPLKCDEYLIRPYGLMVTVEDAVGSSIAWPLSLVILDVDVDGDN